MFEMAIQWFSILAWCAMALYCSPSMVRLLFMRKMVLPLDPLKASLNALAVTQVYLVVARVAYGVSLFQFHDVSWWAAAVACVGFAVLLVIVVLRKTDDALGSILVDRREQANG